MEFAESLKPASTTGTLEDHFGLLRTILDTNLNYLVSFYNLSFNSEQVRGGGVEDMPLPLPFFHSSFLA